MTDSELLDSEIEYTVTSQSHAYIQVNDIDDLSITHLPLRILLSANTMLAQQLDVASLADRLEKLKYTLSADRKQVVMDMEEPHSLTSDDDYWSGEHLSSPAIEDLSEEVEKWDV